MCKRGKVKATFETTLAEGRWLTATLDGAGPIRVELDADGNGEAIWPNAGEGEHRVCVAECPARCDNTGCE